MKTIVVQYRCTSAETADENQRLVEDVFRELEALGDTGFAYTSLRLEDGVRFVHVVVEQRAGATDLTSVPAFQRFLADLGARIDAPPEASAARIVGVHAMFAGAGGSGTAA